MTSRAINTEIREGPTWLQATGQCRQCWMVVCRWRGTLDTIDGMLVEAIVLEVMVVREMVTTEEGRRGGVL